MPKMAATSWCCLLLLASQCICMAAESVLTWTAVKAYSVWNDTAAVYMTVELARAERLCAPPCKHIPESLCAASAAFTVQSLLQAGGSVCNDSHQGLPVLPDLQAHH